MVCFLSLSELGQYFVQSRLFNLGAIHKRRPQDREEGFKKKRTHVDMTEVKQEWMFTFISNFKYLIARSR